MANVCTSFDPRQESILEFIQRFKVQCSEQLTVAADNGLKKAAILVKALPLNVITDLQRRISPVLLSEATYTILEEKLLTQYEVKKSVIGATVQFVNRKQLPTETIENYAKVINNLASSCKYSDCCRDRMLRDHFVSGLHSGKILSGLLQDCESKTFNECVEKAKLLEQICADAQDIKPEQVPNYKVDRYEGNANKGDNAVPGNYVCVRCGSKAKHLARNCFAINLTCNICSKKGHIARACKSKMSKSHAISGQEDERSFYAGNEHSRAASNQETAAAGWSHYDRPLLPSANENYSVHPAEGTSGQRSYTRPDNGMSYNIAYNNFNDDSFLG